MKRDSPSIIIMAIASVEVNYCDNSWGIGVSNFKRGTIRTNQFVSQVGVVRNG